MFMTNQEVQDAAVKYVLDLERAERREPVDARGRAAVDVISSDRCIEVRAFGGTARDGILRLDGPQIREAEDNAGFWLYVVDNVRQGDPTHFGILRFSRDEAVELIRRGLQHLHVETKLTTAEYDVRVRQR